MTQTPLPKDTRPHLLQLFLWITDPFGFLEKSTQRHGDTFILHFHNYPPFTFFSHPQDIQEIFSLPPQSFDSGKGNSILEPFVGDNSLLLLDGQRHKQHRKLMMPPFHGESVKAYGEQIIEITRNIASQWQPEQPLNVRTLMQQITLEVIIQVIFGLQEGSRYEQLKPLLTSMVDLVNSPLRSSFLFLRSLQQDLGPWSPWGNMIRQRRKIHQLLQAEIDERRKHPQQQGNDILSLLLQARDEEGNPLTDVELRDELMTLLFAGHETTATALSWAMYWLHKFPDVQEKLLQELSEADHDPTTLFRLPYLEAVCNETLRLYPVVPITFLRIAKTPITIRGREYPPETILTPCIYLTHHREDIYENANQFQPNHFLNRQYSSGEFLPFGGGSRRCLGAVLAMFELKLVIATLLSEHQFSLAETQPVKPARRGVTVAPKGGIAMVYQGRRKTAEKALVR